MPVAIVGAAVRQAGVDRIGEARGLADTIESDETCETTHDAECSNCGR